MFVGDKIAFIMHPRAASTSVSWVLSDKFGLEHIGKRHSVQPSLLRLDWKVVCIVRNPFDTLVSWYYTRTHFRGTFQEWLNSDDFRDHMWIPYGLFYGLPYATHVLRFENLQSDFNDLCSEVGWPRYKIPHLNKGNRRHAASWMDVVAGCNIPEIKISIPSLFGFEFPA